MIIGTAVVAGILVALLLIMRGENEALNSKIMQLNCLEVNTVGVVNHDDLSAKQFIR